MKKEREESIKESKKLITLAQTPKLWTQGLRFASPDEKSGRVKNGQPSNPKPKEFTPILSARPSN